MMAKGRRSIVLRNTDIVLKSSYFKFLKNTVQNKLVSQLNVGMKGSPVQPGGVQGIVLVGRGPEPKFEEAEALIQNAVNLIEKSVSKCPVPNLTRDPANCDVIELEDVSSEDDAMVHRKENINGLEDVSSDDTFGESKEKSKGSSGTQVILGSNSGDGLCTVTHDTRWGYAPYDSTRSVSPVSHHKKKSQKDANVLTTSSLHDNIHSKKSIQEAGSCLKPSNTILSETEKTASSNTSDDSLIIISSPNTSRSTCTKTLSCTETTAEGDSTIVLPDDTILISSCSEGEDDILIEKVVKKKPSPTKKRKSRWHTGKDATGLIPLRSLSAGSTTESPDRKIKKRKTNRFSDTSTDITSETTDLPCSSKSCPDVSIVQENDLKRSNYRSQREGEDKMSRPTDSSRIKPSFDKNVMRLDFNSPALRTGRKTGLRPIIIDGQNVSREYAQGFVSEDERFKMRMLEEANVLCFTPSRKLPEGKRFASYDDRFIVQTASELGGIIVSNDNYRDLMYENPKWKSTIENRLLMYTWVDMMLMFPNDPLGRHGPHLEEFLRFTKERE